MADVVVGFLKVQEGEEVRTYPLGPEACYKLYGDQEPIVRVWDRDFTRLLAVRYLVQLCLPNKG